MPSSSARSLARRTRQDQATRRNEALHTFVAGVKSCRFSHLAVRKQSSRLALLLDQFRFCAHELWRGAQVLNLITLCRPWTARTRSRSRIKFRPAMEGILRHLLWWTFPPGRPRSSILCRRRGSRKLGRQGSGMTNNQTKPNSEAGEMGGTVSRAAHPLIQDPLMATAFA